MSELAFSGIGLNPITATPPCVNDPKAVPGGSSSGSAASVAFGLAAASIGSDTGGSVRIPAAWNDLVGLKTTETRLSNEGVVPLCSSFDTVGPLARTVEDANLLLAALEGGTPADLRGADLRGKRFAVLETIALDGVRDAPSNGFVRAVEALTRAGAEIEAIQAPEVEVAMALTGPLYTTEAYGEWREVIEESPDLMFDQILERFRAGASFSGPDYHESRNKLEECRAAWHARVAPYDAVICPTAPILPPNYDRLLSDHDYYVSENLLALRNTRIGNLLGLCGVTLPTGVPSCGIMFLGAPFDEERLLRIAAAAEVALA